MGRDASLPICYERVRWAFGQWGRWIDTYRESEIPLNAVVILDAEVALLALEVARTSQIVADRHDFALDRGFGSRRAGLPARGIHARQGAEAEE